eukprot:4410598-Prymnesium_polylepis.1
MRTTRWRTRRASDRSRFGLGNMTSSSPRSGRQAEDEELEATFCLADRRTEGALRQLQGRFMAKPFV